MLDLIGDAGVGLSIVLIAMIFIGLVRPPAKGKGKGK